MSSPSSSLYLLIASAGSGKTQRIAQEALASLERNRLVLAVTFTRKAAAELRSRILHLAAHPSHLPILKKLLFEGSYCETSTIDSLTLRIYQHIAPFLGLPIYQELTVEQADFLQAQRRLLRNLWKELSYKSKYQLIHQAISNYDSEKAQSLSAIFRKAFDTLIRESPIRIQILKGILLSPMTPSSSPSELFENAQLAAKKFLSDFLTEALYDLMETILRRYRQEYRTLFLSDLQYVVELTARNVPLFVALPYRHIQHLLLDEAQDTSLLQWTILEPIMEEVLASTHPIHIVGDAKQSIYAWRGAELSYFLGLRSRATQTLLDRNYRSRRRIIAFNNHFYARAKRCLENLIGSSSSQKSPHNSLSVQHILEVYDKHYQRKGRIDRRDARHLRQPFHSVVRVRGYLKEEELAQSLRRALRLLRQLRIRPQETAFLVRRNDDIHQLRRLLPEYELQITSYELGQVPTLYATMELLTYWQEDPQALRQAPPPAAKYFLEYYGLYPSWEKLFLSRTPPPESAADWWQVFYDFAKILQEHVPSEAIFWQFFLDKLWTFVEGQVAPTLKDILIWWQEKGSEMEVQAPLGPNTYPVLTIHRAKGLAWDAVIIPFADWQLFDYKAKQKWYSTEKITHLLNLCPAIANALKNSVNDLLNLPTSDISYNAELPLLIGSKDKIFLSLYAEDTKTFVLESFNLHYVATTRPKRALFIYYPIPGNRVRTFPQNWAYFHRTIQNQSS